MTRDAVSPLLHVLNHNHLNAISPNDQQKAIRALELGQVLHLPEYYFDTKELTNTPIFSETLLDNKHKNISFDIKKMKLGGFKEAAQQGKLSLSLQAFLQAYAAFAKQLVDTLLPQYSAKLQWGRTSWRPAQILGRSSSKRKDDTRLHVDSFAATPVHGLRILRVFCNTNPYGEPRVWHLGEPFCDVASQFLPEIPQYRPKLASLLYFLKVTKSLRSAYDHYQLQLHDRMKQNDAYQAEALKTLVNFPAQSTWLVFTDQVSHAALQGQYLLEQTFYLPVNAMQSPETSPLHYWREHKGVEVLAREAVV